MKSPMMNQPAPSGRGMRAACLGLIPAMIILCLAAGSNPELSASNDQSNAPKLVGSWLVTVTAEGYGTFQALESYNVGGTMIGSDPSPYPLYPMTTPLHGAWARKGPQEFVLKTMNFQYDNADDGYPDGLQKNIIKQNLTVDVGGDTYNGQGTAEWYDSTGALVFVLRFTTHGTRLLAE